MFANIFKKPHRNYKPGKNKLVADFATPVRACLSV